MAKKPKLSTPDWIKEGYDSKEEYDKAKGIKSTKKTGKIYKVKECPKCKSNEVEVILSGAADEGVDEESDEDDFEDGNSAGMWKCRNCGWKGNEIKEKELTEEQFLKYLDEKEKKEGKKNE